MDTSDKLNQYPKILTAYLQEIAAERNSGLGNDMEYQTISDTGGGHFQLLRTGWHNERFIFQVLIHADIKPNGKVWVQQNITELPLGEDLQMRGIPKSDMVIGFRPEYLRRLSEYAVA